LTMKFFFVLAVIAAVYGQTIQEIEKIIEFEDDTEGITYFVKVLNKHYPKFIKDDEIAIVAKEFQLVTNSTDKSQEVLLSIAPVIMGKVVRLVEQTMVTFRSLSKETKQYVADLKTNIMMAYAFSDKKTDTVDDFRKTFSSIFDPLYDDFNSQSETVKRELKDTFPLIFHFIEMRNDLFDLMKKHEERINQELLKAVSK
ncbi:hypothetical protein PFISCL1PPCAC_1427, partial [Pristionchus fissidentatus]